MPIVSWIMLAGFSEGAAGVVVPLEVVVLVPVPLPFPPNTPFSK
jgi:hypothetical protein